MYQQEVTSGPRKIVTRDRDIQNANEATAAAASATNQNDRRPKFPGCRASGTILYASTAKVLTSNTSLIVVTGIIQRLQALSPSVLTAPTILPASTTTPTNPTATAHEHCQHHPWLELPGALQYFYSARRPGRTTILSHRISTAVLHLRMNTNPAAPTLFSTKSKSKRHPAYLQAG